MKPPSRQPLKLPSQILPRNSPTQLPTALIVCIVIAVISSVGLIALLAWYCLTRNRAQVRSNAAILPNPIPHQTRPPTDPPPQLPRSNFPQKPISLSASLPHHLPPAGPSKPSALTPSQKTLLARLENFPMDSDTTATATELETPKEVVNPSFIETVRKREREEVWSGLSARERMLLGSDASTVMMQEEWMTSDGGHGQEWRGKGKQAWHEGQDRESSHEDEERERSERDEMSHQRRNVHVEYDVTDDDEEEIDSHAASHASSIAPSPSPSMSDLRHRSAVPRPLRMGGKGGR